MKSKKRVQNVRHGGRTADRVMDIEERDPCSDHEPHPPIVSGQHGTCMKGITQHRLAGLGSSWKIQDGQTTRYSTHLFVDTTFKVVPAAFKLLLVVMAKDVVNDLISRVSLF
uniref:Uncharacterized protein n=1 Tax=Spongospora subterranea TaxID=70186 RepID=A0A0H5RRI5_9EUKA|eukprot:CRZ11314.1 hypothetical protein [Spongospora subterranea]